MIFEIYITMANEKKHWHLKIEMSEKSIKNDVSNFLGVGVFACDQLPTHFSIIECSKISC